MATVVFVHGLYLTHRCWQGWRQAFEAQGHATVAPEWPGHEGEPAALRASPDPALLELDLEQVFALHREVVAAMEEPPILVGHSMGGLIVQRLLAEGHGAGGVAVDSAPPNGLTSFKWSFLRSNLPILAPGTRPILLSKAQFHYAFTHTMSAEASAEIYEAHVVPEARGVAKGPLGPAGRFDWASRTAPLLLVAGGEDRVIPPSLVRKNAAKQQASGARTDLREFPGRTHFLLGQDGWEEIAEHVLNWLKAT